MASLPIYYCNQPLLSPATDDDDEGDHKGLTGGRRSSTAPPLKLCGDTLNNGGGSSGELQADDIASRIKRCQTAPDYVSFEDVIGREGRISARWLPDVDGIRDPLVRKASLLYAGDTALLPPRHSSRSPGPLGTRRGSFMHRLVKKYVSPCLGFLASAFLRGSDASAKCPISS